MCSSQNDNDQIEDNLALVQLRETERERARERETEREDRHILG